MGTYRRGDRERGIINAAHNTVIAKKKPSFTLRTAGPKKSVSLATIVAILALIVSIVSLYESHQTRISTVRDEILLRAHRSVGSQAISIRKTQGLMRLGAISVPWNLVISNTGNSTVSIVGYQLLEISEKGPLFHSELDRGLFNPENHQPMSLPIVLEAGRSTRLIAVVGITPGERAYEALTKNIVGNEKTIPLRDAENLLASKFLDIYDNPVAPLDLGVNVSGSVWRVENMDKEQIFLFRVKTARGAEATETSSWYDFRRY